MFASDLDFVDQETEIGLASRGVSGIAKFVCNEPPEPIDYFRFDGQGRRSQLTLEMIDIFRDALPLGGDVAEFGRNLRIVCAYDAASDELDHVGAFATEQGIASPQLLELGTALREVAGPFPLYVPRLWPNC